MRGGMEIGGRGLKVFRCLIKKWPNVKIAKLFQGGINQVTKMKDSSKC